MFYLATSSTDMQYLNQSVILCTTFLCLKYGLSSNLTYMWWKVNSSWRLSNGFTIDSLFTFDLIVIGLLFIWWHKTTWDFYISCHYFSPFLFRRKRCHLKRRIRPTYMCRIVAGKRDGFQRNIIHRFYTTLPPYHLIPFSSHLSSKDWFRKPAWYFQMNVHTMLNLTSFTEITSAQ